MCGKGGNTMKDKTDELQEIKNAISKQLDKVQDKKILMFILGFVLNIQK